MKKRNTSARKLALPIEWQVRPTSWGGARWQHRQESGDDVYDRTFPNVSDLEWYLADRYGWRFAKKVLAALKTSTGDPVGKRNPQTKGKTALKKTGRALKSFARGALQSGAEILGAGAMALNPSRRRKKNKTIIKAKRIDHLDVSKVHNPRKRNTTAKKPSKAKRLAKLAVKGLAKKNPFSPMGFEHRKGHEFGSPPLRGQKAAKLRLRLNRLTERWAKAKTPAQLAKIKKEMDATWAQLKAVGVQNPKAKRNASRTVSSAKTAKRRARASSQGGRKVSKARSKKIAVKRNASPTTRTKSSIRSRKAPTRRASKRTVKKSSRVGKRRNPTPQVLAIVNPKSKAAQNRKDFAGEYRRDTPLRFPEGTPKGLSKLGKLLKIKTDRAVITPINNQTWLVRDLKGKLHIGTTSTDGLIWSGPAEDFGKVKRIEYEDVKKHLGYDRPQGFYHFMGEEDGIRPRLYADGRGGLKFKGGNYRITPEGIVN